MRLPKWPVFYSILLVVLLLLHGQTAEARKRETRTLVLENGLAVLLIHDPQVHRSAAALSVGVGDLYDPEEKMGLAHYLEHMLFLGTKKYPAVDSFEKYLAAHSGDSNAYTGSVLTNYFFEASHEAFEGALDRFSQFFKNPLFDEQYAEREISAVDSEYEKNRLRDGWRARYAINQVSEEGHPIRKFGLGNKETLGGHERAALLDFYHRYYVASRMKLAILSSLPISVQEESVKRYFAGIPDRPVEMPPIDPAYRKPLKDQYRLMKIKAIRDIHRLTLKFPTIRLHDYLESKPAVIVGSVIGYEGKGSLLSKLKEEGLALGLSAGGGYDHPNISSFDISIQLTKKGEENYERVLEYVFYYIQMLREHGFEKYTFKEIQTMAQIDFDWRDPQEGMGYVASVSALMQDYKLEDVVTLPYLYRKYRPALYMAILDTLKPENMLAVLQSRSVETNRTGKFYGVRYSLTKVGGTAFEKLRHPPPVEGMRYPEKNGFIPYHLTLIEEAPRLVLDNDRAKVWFKFDHRLKQPKVNIKLRIETPHAYDTVKNAAQARMYEMAVREGLNEITYPMEIAGLWYQLQVTKKGIILTVGGYSERISDLLGLLARNLTRISIDERKFNDLKRDMIRSVENRKLSRAFSRAAYYNRRLWSVKEYSEEELIKAFKAVTLEGLKEYASRLYDRAFITGVADGNWTEDRVRQSLKALLAGINCKALPEQDRYQERIEVLDAGEKVLFSKQVADNNNALYYAIQVGPMGFSRYAKASLVASIIQTDFYTQMRTNQQLGYIVWSFHSRVEDRLFLKFIIQSPSYGPFQLKARVETWMRKSMKLFDGLTDEAFERYRKSLIVSLEKRGESIAEVTRELYDYATKEKGNFRFKRQLVRAVKKLRKEEVVAAARAILLNPETPRIVILIRAHDSKERIPEGVLTSVSQFKSRKGKHTAGGKSGLSVEAP